MSRDVMNRDVMNSSEASRKLASMRSEMSKSGLEAIRLRGVDWFAWATCGGNSAVILTGDTGIAEVLVTAQNAYVLTNHIEAQRLREEEVPADFEVLDFPWSEETFAYDRFVRDNVKGAVASDRPLAGERSLPSGVVDAKRTFEPEEIERYRAIGRDAGLAMKEALEAADPTWTEDRLAGEGARAMWKRGLHPTLTLVAGEKRLKTRRHPFPSSAPLAGRAMLVYCARRAGLYANLTRFVYFRKPTPDELKHHDDLLLIEAAILNATKPGVALRDCYQVLNESYEKFGYHNEILQHHQGGTCGYLSRETVATPSRAEVILENSAVAWNPSLVGAKMEDTFLVTSRGLENLTAIDAWPSVSVDGRSRPWILTK